MKLFVISTVAALIAFAPTASAKEASDARDLDQAQIAKCMDKTPCRAALKKAIHKTILQYQHSKKKVAYYKSKPKAEPAPEHKPETTQLPALPKVRPMEPRQQGIDQRGSPY